MTRPRKQKVDWFPHSCTHGKTIFVLEKKYGLKGYVFWFKLLEILGDTEGHYVDLNEPATKEFLQAYTSGESDTDDILETLASLEAIDREAWAAKIIWSANFIKGIAQTYLNRRVEPPPRPDNYINKLTPGSVPTGSLQPIIQEGKGREGKGREGEKNKRTEGAPPPPNGSGGALVPVTPLAFSCPHFDIEADYFQQLSTDYPGLDNGRLLAEIKKAADYCSDNPKKHKRDSRGRVVNKKLYLRNWMERAQVPGQRGGPMSKAEQMTAANLKAAREAME